MVLSQILILALGGSSWLGFFGYCASNRDNCHGRDGAQLVQDWNNSHANYPLVNPDDWRGAPDTHWASNVVR